MNKFVIFTTQRTGSTLLSTLLDSHPNVRCHSEVLMRKAHSADSYWKYNQNNKLKKSLHSLFTSSYGKYIPAGMQSRLLYPFLNSLYSNNHSSRPWKKIEDWERELQDDNANDQAVGFKLMQKQLDINHCFTGYAKKNHLDCIHLYRENLLDTYLSGLSLKKTGVAHTQNPSLLDNQKFSPLMFSVSDFKEHVKHHKSAHSLRKEWISQIPNNVIEVSYEQLNQDCNSVANRIFKFLGVSPYECKETLKKVTHSCYSTRVSNWLEVESAVVEIDYYLT